MKNALRLLVLGALLLSGVAHAQVGPLDARNNLADVANGAAALAHIGGTPLFGTGADGALVCSSGIVTFNRDMNYTNVTISGTCAINTNGFRMFGTGTLDISAAPTGAIQSNGPSGNAASGASGGSQPARLYSVSNTFLPQLVNVTSGGAGNATTGTNPSFSPASVPASYGNAIGATGGAGGNGTSVGAAGLAGLYITVGSFEIATPILSLVEYFSVNTGSPTPYIIQCSFPGGPGGQGGGDGTNFGGGGATGAMGGGMVVVQFATIARGTNTNAGIFQSRGGTGGAGGAATAGNAGGGGGGAAGSGGTVFIVTQKLTGSTITNAIDVSGGNGGPGGAGVGTGKGGTGGAGAGGGAVFLHVIGATPSFATIAPGTAGSAATTATTTAGTPGGTGVTAEMNI